MAHEFKHGKDTGVQLDKIEFEESTDMHMVDGINFGDVVVISNPPSGYYKIFNIYMAKVGAIYQLYIDHSDIPES
jgi:hypothetical protein